jgi:hypothetical protein
MFLTGCSLLTQLAPPVANFGLGLYNADSYYSKECLWYEEVKFSPNTKEWLKSMKTPPHVISDIAKVARNNDLFKEVCKK